MVRRLLAPTSLFQFSERRAGTLCTAYSTAHHQKQMLLVSDFQDDSTCLISLAALLATVALTVSHATDSAR